MSSPQPYRIAVRRPDGVHHYVLQRRVVQLRGGKTQEIYFFAAEDAGPEAKLAMRAIEHDWLTPEWLAHVALDLAGMQGLDADVAARTAAGLKASIEGLADSQTDELAREIRSRMT